MNARRNAQNATARKETARVSIEEVRNVPQPEFTKTWRPYAHGAVVDVIEAAVKELGLKVAHKQYSLSTDGLRMVGAYGIDTPRKKGEPRHQIYEAIIFRNSMDKSQSLGIAGGTDCWVCENLAVWGRYVEFRKHDGTLDEKEMGLVVMRGIQALKPRMEQTLDFHRAMETLRLTEAETKAMAYDAIQERIISHQRLPLFNEILFGESHRYDPTTLFGFHGAATELMRDMNLTNTIGFQAKQTKLNNMIFERFGDRLPKIDGVGIEVPEAEVK